MTRESMDRPPHDEFLGLPFCLLSLDQTVRLIVEQCDGPYGYVVTPNAYHLVAVREGPAHLQSIYQGARLSLCDSQIVRRLAAFEGRALPHVTGSDVVAALLAEQNVLSPDRGRKRLLVVGPDGTVLPALRARYPHVDIKIMPAPPGLAQRADLRLQVARACVQQPWDILLLCVGCPAQELIAALIATLGRRTGLALCVGASIDFVTGERARAPRWLQQLGLEWAFRLVHEPRRLWRRYLIESPKVFRIFFMARFARHH
jgi:N-acetylglucosaminyldiphosphoundecaprenol N-acetyl-beta-D-mannosaminyltransferase